uniref:Elongation of very long chain fatty acids protein n=1 Tax=Trichobilharzia regenti TaxID=157069 RepID=A0AA85J7P0_TRIRE|nr:unnamed protein product [Trichobilharzia regenti]
MYKTLTDWLSEQLLPPQPDPRVADYPLMSTWTPSVLISLVYSIGAYIWRRELIRRHGKTERKYSSKEKVKHHKKRSVLTYAMIMYNFTMVLFSIYLTISSFYSIYQLGYGLGCIELPNPEDKRTDKLVYLGYLFFISKFIEMMDTVFFLCRGKVDQVTFLHVFHHASMPPSVWWGLKYAPGGLIYMFPLVNSFVHILMYTYYGLAAIGVYHLLWWKNYLTLIQMIQFLWFIFHQGQFLINNPSSCNFPKVFPTAIVIIL